MLVLAQFLQVLWFVEFSEEIDPCRQPLQPGKSKISSVRLWPFLVLARDEFMHQKMLAYKGKRC